MTGRITRLIDTKQVGAISGEDGQEYDFHARTLIGVQFGDLSLGAAVTFEPGTGPGGSRRAVAVRLAGK